MKLQTTINRLNKLADLLDRVPAKDFNYDVWIEDNNKKLVLKPGKTCGTAGCALGWATTIPSLRRAGLRMDDCGEPVCNDSYTFDAGEEVFGLEANESEYLFSPDSKGESSATPKQVAKKIRKFIKTKVEKTRAEKARDRLQKRLYDLDDNISKLEV